jgi:AraC-like DNA-binding protein
MHDPVHGCGSPGIASPLVAAILEYGMSPDAVPPRVAELARRLRITPRALADRLHRERLPAPRQLLAWCVVNRAVHALHNRRTRLNVIAWELGLSNSYSLRRVIRRVLSATPTAIRSWSAEQGDRALAASLARLITGRTDP